MDNQTAYDELLVTILDFVKNHPDPIMQHFRTNVANWGTQSTVVPAVSLPVAQSLKSALEKCDERTRPFTETFERLNDQLRWEQTYTKNDPVSSDMLNNYGFAEVIGKQGPFMSDTIRSGLGIYGANVTYPRHQHKAEEVYGVLSGTATFNLDGVSHAAKVGDFVHVPSMTPHGFTCDDDPIVLFYIWQNGDMREKSTFN